MLAEPAERVWRGVVQGVDPAEADMRALGEASWDEVQAAILARDPPLEFMIFPRESGRG